MDAPLTITAAGPIVMVGARLTPSGLHQVLPMAQHELLGRVVPLDSVWQQWTRRTAEAVSAAGSAEQELATFEQSLEQLVRSRPVRPDRTVDAAWRAMRRQGGPLPVAAIADASGISRRQFERRFLERVGLSPRVFGRIVRFQQALGALQFEPGAQLAARLGYVDQAHLIKEIRRFSGTTPTALANADSLASFFVNRTVV
jgi:AraC-like DNA-binding protein